MPDLICFGEPMVEFNEQRDGSYLQGFGGDASNCAIAASRQGAATGFLTHVGDDRIGRTLFELWQAEGVDASLVKVDPAASTGIYFVTHSEAGHEFSYYRAGSASSRVAARDIPGDALQQAKILHVSGISQGISSSASDAVFAAMDAVRAGGGRVSYDSNLRLKLWPLTRARAIIHEAMSQCDIALPGFDDAVQLTGLDQPDAIVDFYLTLGASIVALTLGEQGTLVATPDKRTRIDAWPVKAIDATGAGDTFDGAFLARLIAGDDPFEAASYANAAAALSTQGYGAVAPIPAQQAVQDFMASRQAV